ncbi:MAG: transcriptional regulator NrdR [Rhabdochlamydiaceae bacterium]|nr:transcriptional regulator NrdR [Candidatus Amphrikana amoebophyrae]
MQCPFCGDEDIKVTDSRNATDANAIRRRRQCLSCQKRFTTFETVDLAVQVKKRDGSYQDFNLEKLTNGLSAACRHTRVGPEQVSALSSEVSSEIMEKGLREIETTVIGEMIMQKLKVLDTIAYIRFACVYRRFKDMDELINAIQSASTLETIMKN